MTRQAQSENTPARFIERQNILKYSTYGTTLLSLTQRSLLFFLLNFEFSLKKKKKNVVAVRPSYTIQAEQQQHGRFNIFCHRDRAVLYIVYDLYDKQY